MPNQLNVTRPVLIIGPGRSASSWLNDIFAQHRMSRNVIENSIVDDFQRDLTEAWWRSATRFECEEHVWMSRCVGVVRESLRTLFPGSETVWSMKAIWEGHDWKFWRQVFPDMRCIHLIRHPVPSVDSMIRKMGPDLPHWKDPAFCCGKYVSGHQQAFDLQSSGVPYIQLRQEEILRSPGESLAAVLEFAGLPPDERVRADNWVNRGPAHDPGQVDVTWETLTPECREMAKRLGYTAEETLNSPLTSVEFANPKLDENLFAVRPWNSDELMVDNRAPGMLQTAERNMLYILARDYYSGTGEIIDGGALLGASALSFARGLSENARVSIKERRIHCYDKFKADEPYLRAFVGGLIQRDLESDDFESLFIRNMGDYLRHVQICKGDFLDKRWGNRPVEILFIDIAKTPDLNRHALMNFFPTLITGRSLVIHQDYHHPVLPHIHLSMEALADYFEILDEKVGDSIIFRTKRDIPPQLLRKAARLEFAPEEKMELMNRAVDRLGTANQPHVKLARAKLIFQLYGRERLLEELSRIDQEYPTPPDDHWENYRFSMLPRNCGLIASTGG